MMISAQDVLEMQRQMAAIEYDSDEDDNIEVRRRSTAHDANGEGPTSDTEASTPRSDQGHPKHKERETPNARNASEGNDDNTDDKKDKDDKTESTEPNNPPGRAAMTRRAQRSAFMSLIDQSRSMRRLAMEQSHHGRPASVVTAQESDLFNDEFDAAAVDDEQYNDSDEDFKLGDPLHEETACLGPSRNAVGRVINQKYVQWGVMFLILANSLILGALTFLHGPQHISSREALEATNLAMLIVFTVELSAQVYYLGLQFLRQGWLMFDAIVILASWAFEGSDLAVMRSFRIFRLFTMIAKWTSLRHLVKAIGKTMPKMGTIAAVLVLFFYSFSVFYTNLYFGLYEDGHLDWDYFGRLDLTFLTLFQVMTMDSWTVMVRQLMESGRHWAWVGFVIWVIITAFFFVSLIVAVVCESLFELNDIKEKKRQKKMFKHQNNVVKNQTKMLMDENKQLLEIQKEMLANQIVMQKTLMEVVEQLREYKNNDPSDNGTRASRSEAGEQSISEKSMTNLFATFEADGSLKGEGSTSSFANKAPMARRRSGGPL